MVMVVEVVVLVVVVVLSGSGRGGGGSGCSSGSGSGGSGRCFNKSKDCLTTKSLRDYTRERLMVAALDKGPRCGLNPWSSRLLFSQVLDPAEGFFSGFSRFPSSIKT